MMSDKEVQKLLVDLEKTIAVMSERERNQTKIIEDLLEDVTTLKESVSQLHSMANRWKGGFIVLAAMGGVVGWLSSFSNSILSMFK